jgi:predicted DNA binding protein
MPEARLNLTIPDDIWVGELTRQHPDTTFRVCSALPDEETGTALAEVAGDSVSAVLDEMDDSGQVTKVEMLNDGDEYALVQFETTVPLLLLAARDSGVPLELPFEISDGTAVWEVTASSDRLSELSSQLESFGISFSIDHLRYEISEEPLLTDSQRELVETALERGYYDTPRCCSLTDLADEIDQAKSTVSETLHRAEETMIKQFVDTDQ